MNRSLMTLLTVFLFLSLSSSRCFGRPPTLQELLDGLRPDPPRHEPPKRIVALPEPPLDILRALLGGSGMTPRIIIRKRPTAAEEEDAFQPSRHPPVIRVVMRSDRGSDDDNEPFTPKLNLDSFIGPRSSTSPFRPHMAKLIRIDPHPRPEDPLADRIADLLSGGGSGGSGGPSTGRFRNQPSNRSGSPFPDLFGGLFPGRLGNHSPGLPANHNPGRPGNQLPGLIEDLLPELLGSRSSTGRDNQSSHYFGNLSPDGFQERISGGPRNQLFSGPGDKYPDGPGKESSDLFGNRFSGGLEDLFSDVLRSHAPSRLGNQNPDAFDATPTGFGGNGRDRLGDRYDGSLGEQYPGRRGDSGPDRLAERFPGLFPDRSQNSRHPSDSSDPLGMLGAILDSPLNPVRGPTPIGPSPTSDLFGFGPALRRGRPGADLNEEDSPLQQAINQHMGAIGDLLPPRDGFNGDPNRPTVFRINLGPRDDSEPELLPSPTFRPVPSLEVKVLPLPETRQPIPVKLTPVHATPAKPKPVTTRRSITVNHGPNARPVAKKIQIKGPIPAGPDSVAHVVTETTATPVQTQTHIVRNGKSVVVHKKNTHKIQRKHHVVIQKRKKKTTFKMKRLVFSLPLASQSQPQSPPPTLSPAPQVFYPTAMPMPVSYPTPIPVTYPTYQPYMTPSYYPRVVRTVVADTPQAPDEHHMDKTTITTSGNFSQLGAALATIEADISRLNSNPPK